MRVADAENLCFRSYCAFDFFVFQGEVTWQLQKRYFAANSQNGFFVLAKGRHGNEGFEAAWKNLGDGVDELNGAVA